MATLSTASFLSLPPEIRILVYEHLLVTSRDGTLRAISHRPRPSPKTPGVPPLCGTPKSCFWCISSVDHYTCWAENMAYPPHSADRTLMARTGGRIYPAILSVSKIVYKEAMPLLYFNLQLSFLITGHDDVHDILKSLPKFPCNVPQIQLYICPEMVVTASEREIMMDAISILEVVLNQFKPVVFSGTVYAGQGNKKEVCQGIAHEMFRKCFMMRTKDPLAVMSEAKEASLSRGTNLDNKACQHINATLDKTYERHSKKSRDELPKWLERSCNIRQNI